MQTEARAPRRGPGRPPKKTPPPAVEKKGRAEAPVDADNRLECVYGEPATFRSLFSYFGRMQVKAVHLLVSPAGITFFARSDSHGARIVVRLPAEEAGHFYAEDSFRLCLNQEIVGGIFASIDSSFYKIAFLHPRESTRFEVILYNHELDKECRYRASLSEFRDDPLLFEAEAQVLPERLKECPLSWEFDSRCFKKTVGDANKMANNSVLMAEKMGRDAPLQLTYRRAEQQFVYVETYDNPAKIGLKVARPDHTGSYALPPLKSLSPLGHALVTERVRIHCGQGQDVVFSGQLSGCEVFTVMEAAGARPAHRLF